jgi:hypothetical protein
LLDLGINTSGEFQVGLKLDDSTQVWFNVSVQLPPAPKLAVDANRDGTITFDATDATSATAPYRFWLNDDDDTGFGPSFPWANSDPEYYPPRRADSSDQVINSQRDGEDLTRIWVNAAGMIDTVKNLSSDLYLGLKWKNTTGHPSIRLFRSADPDGGLGHIKNALVAFGATAGASGDTTAPKCGLGDADAQKRMNRLILCGLIFHGSESLRSSRLCAPRTSFSARTPFRKSSVIAQPVICSSKACRRARAS